MWRPCAKQGLHPGTSIADEVSQHMRAIERDPRTEAASALRRQGMAPEDVAGILAEGDPAVVRRHLELHREVLAERLDEELRTVNRIERALMAWATVSDGRSGDVA